jgi:hypothetical protein
MPRIAHAAEDFPAARASLSPGALGPRQPTLAPLREAGSLCVYAA